MHYNIDEESQKLAIMCKSNDEMLFINTLCEKVEFYIKEDRDENWQLSASKVLKNIINEKIKDEKVELYKDSLYNDFKNYGYESEGKQLIEAVSFIRSFSTGNRNFLINKFENSRKSEEELNKFIEFSKAITRKHIEDVILRIETKVTSSTIEKDNKDTEGNEHQLKINRSRIRENSLSLC